MAEPTLEALEGAVEPVVVKGTAKLAPKSKTKAVAKEAQAMMEGLVPPNEAEVAVRNAIEAYIMGQSVHDAEGKILSEKQLQERLFASFASVKAEMGTSSNQAQRITVFQAIVLMMKMFQHRPHQLFGNMPNKVVQNLFYMLLRPTIRPAIIALVLGLSADAIVRCVERLPNIVKEVLAYKRRGGKDPGVEFGIIMNDYFVEPPSPSEMIVVGAVVGTVFSFFRVKITRTEIERGFEDISPSVAKKASVLTKDIMEAPIGSTGRGTEKDAETQIEHILETVQEAKTVEAIPGGVETGRLARKSKQSNIAPFPASETADISQIPPPKRGKPRGKGRGRGRGR